MLSLDTAFGSYDSPEKLPKLGNTLPDDPSVKWGTDKGQIIVAMQGVGVVTQKFTPGDWKLHMHVTSLVDNLRKKRDALMGEQNETPLSH
jgi:hypothetical protein